MKIIKIILAIIIVLTGVFFATGLVVKQTQYTVEIEVDKPVEQVFKQFDNPANLKEWLPEIQTIKPIEEKPSKTGSSYQITVVNQGETMLMTEKIMAYIPNEKITFQFISDTMIKTDDYNFIANKNKTKIIQHCTVQAKTYIMGCVFPWFTSKLKDISKNYMQRFKKMVEKK